VVRLKPEMTMIYIPIFDHHAQLIAIDGQFDSTVLIGGKNGIALKDIQCLRRVETVIVTGGEAE
jgi:hypothetical protein